MKLIPGLILASFLALSCSGRQDGFDCASLLKECAELACVEYTYDMLFQNGPAKWENLKPGPRKILYSGKAVVKAGIDITDLSNVSSEVSENGRHLEVTLPKPEILDIRFEEENIKREFEKVGALRMDFTNDERQEIRKNALRELRRKLENESAKASIIADAKANVSTEMEMLILASGRYDSVTIVFE